MELLAPRKSPSFGRLEAFVLVLYAALSGCLVRFHEPWGDEAQAWLIARDSSLLDIFLKRLHYEGTPGLWHLFLWTLVRCHLSFAGMHWATALVGVAGVFVLLRYAPFPAWLRATLPFTFPLLFQTSVIARSYSMVPLLVFLTCCVLCSRRRSPLAFAILAGLLANTSLIALVLAVSFVPVYWQGLRSRRTDTGSERQNHLLAGALLLMLLGFAVYTAVPAPDAMSSIAGDLNRHPPIARLFSKLSGIPQTASVIEPPNPINLPQPQEMWRPLARLRHGSIPSAIAHRTLGFFDFAFFSVSSWNLLALAFYVAFLCWQQRYHALLDSLPLLAVLAGGTLLHLTEHHTSVIALALIAALWLTWHREAAAGTPSILRVNRIFQLLLLAVVIEQIGWTAHAAIYDIRGPFDGSVQAAQFLLPRVAGHRIASVGGTSILPYTDHNIYMNTTTTYWPWRQGINPNEDLAGAIASHPDYLVANAAYTGNVTLNNQIVNLYLAGQSEDGPAQATYFVAHGYRETHRFCGRQPAHFGFAIETCTLIYEPTSGLPSPGQP